MTPSPPSARRYGILLCVFAAICFAAPAMGEPPSKTEQKEGRTFAIAGAKAYRAKNFKEALENFEKAQTLYPSGQVWRMTGYTLMAMERWVPAAEALETSLKAEFKPLLPRDAEHAEDNLAEVLKHVTNVKMRSAADGATVSTDDGEERALPLEIRLAEGMHRFVVRAPGHDTLDKSINLEGGKTADLDLDPNKRQEEIVKPPAAEEKKKEVEAEEPGKPFNLFGGFFPHQRTIGIAVGGLGVALGAAAIATGVGGLSLRGAVSENIDAHNSNYDAQCSQHATSCLADIALINRDGERAHQMQKTGMILGITAGATLAIGGTFFLLAPDGPLAGNKSDGPDSAQIACAPWAAPGPDSTQAGLSCLGRF